jgi:molybdate transport system substrate-binding protein
VTTSSIGLRQRAAFFVIVTFLTACIGCGEKEKTMLFHAGVGQRSSLLDVEKAFVERHPDVSINFSFKGSGYFIADIARSKEGDLFLPGEEFYLLQAVERGYIEDYDPERDIAAHFMVVIATPKGNPANITKIEDFARPGVRVGLGNPKACAIGIWDEKIFKRAGIWEEVKKNQAQSAKCIAEVLNTVQHKVVDATLLWSSTAVLALNDIEIIPIEPKYRGFVRLPVAITTFSEHTDLAQQLKDFILSDDGAAIFRSHAYVTDPGPLDEDGFCTDGGKASKNDCKWLVEAAKVVKDKSIPVNEKTCGHLVGEVQRQRQTERAGSL